MELMLTQPNNEPVKSPDNCLGIEMTVALRGGGPWGSWRVTGAVMGEVKAGHGRVMVGICVPLIIMFFSKTC